MATKTKAPSGITISREDTILTNEKTMKFSVEWKIADKNYNKGQKFRYVLGKGSDYDLEQRKITVTDKPSTDVTVGTRDTAKSVTLNLTDFYPASGKPFLDNFTVYIKGQRSSRKWSDESSKKYTLLPPPIPIVSEELLSDVSNETRFSWELDNVEKKEQLFYDFEWQSILVQNANYSDGSEAGDAWNNIDPNEKGSSDPGATSSSTTIIEDTSLFVDDYSYTRWFRVRSRGPAGYSKWVYTKHVYTRALRAQNVTASVTPINETGGNLVTVKWDASSRYDKPIDSVSVQYSIVAPAVTYEDADNVRHMTLSCPDSPSWSNVDTVKDTENNDALIFELDAAIDADKLLFIRVNTKHDRYETLGNPVIAVPNSSILGYLAAPSNIVVEVNDTTHMATITAENNSTVPNSYLAIYYRESSAPSNTRIIGIIPAGASTSGAINVPDWGDSQIDFGVKAVVGDYSPATRTQGAVNIYQITPKMESNDILWNGGEIPLPPTIRLSSPSNGTIQVKWDWTWDAATSAELSWSDHNDAWESTDGPSTYVVSNMHASQWNISGLSYGTYYVRVRLINTSSGGETFGTYSNIAEIKLASAPDIPALTLSPTVITQDGSTTGYWAYASNDDSVQSQAEICADTTDNIIARTETAQSITLRAEDYGWAAGETHNLAVRVISASGEASVDWSPFVPLTIANNVVATIVSTSLENRTVGDRTILCLTDLPLTVESTGAGEGGKTSVIIERAADYHMIRPDDINFDGYSGETIASITVDGERTVTITQNDLIGRLDDGAPYRLVVLVKDSYGQTNYAYLDFDVRWDHQAVMPEAVIEVQQNDYVTFITPTQPQEGYLTGDTCDIYRLSADKPELIYSGAEFGTKYVDPYPTLGEFGGHRIVYKTLNKDYITADNQPAWTDYDVDDNDVLHVFATIIDFGQDQVILPYNISVSNSWSKDFTETHYLGGAIQGDWRPGVGRKVTVKSVIAIEENPETVEAIRRLSEYTGICHVRTPEGSSFAADVQVTDDRDERWVNRLGNISLSITRVDTEGFDGLAYDDWYTEESEEEDEG